MTALYMLRLEPDVPRLLALAHSRRLLSARSDDLGYALHSLLVEAFGPHALRPFCFLEKRSGAAILGYGGHDAELLISRARETADPATYAALKVDALSSKPMPERWTVGRRYAFESRVRPVIRRSAPEKGEGRVQERDAFLATLHKAGQGARVDRGDVYLRWFASRLEPAVRLVRSEVAAIKRTHVARRDNGRKLRLIEGPDVVVRGVLEIVDDAAFRALLRRGIGRHTSFGFGMLLLKPA